MSLLTPSESHAFQSFLSSMDYTPSDPQQEWSPHEQYLDQNSYPFSPENIPQIHGKEALAKATKDLMSLDHRPWGNTEPSEPDDIRMRYEHRSLHPMEQREYDHGISQHHLYPYAHPLPPFSGHNHPPSLGHSTPQQAPNPFLYLEPLSASSSGSSSRNSPKRTSSDIHNHSTTKRQRANPSAGSSKRQSSPSRNHDSSQPTSKPTLLSPSQKKANHIQSEQKRRANIRRGYEALCSTVPALREAIKAEEEALANGLNGDGDSGSKGRRKGAARKKTEDGEKLDGRAGPRSENVVLGKTIEYITELLSERATLLARLDHARNLLPPNSLPPCPNPLWEREWKGGEGRNGIGEDDDDDESS